ncbi:hypothetical protein K2173_024311 [Erythroxylum novogranatense]|uniref:Btz domain-containing protein n=1 Tax=Erythroxylum novogranatense TaxID=1862640 RepID=A0AAV8STX6_9ROSI|nr:hypothetical protein K2173_024311 [Erythroxylum novogranatense]
MAKVGEEEVEYESDPEEEKGLLVRRRREAASDDEEGEAEEKVRVDRRPPIHSDESDGQGGAADYDDDDDEGEEEEIYEDEEEDEEEEVYDEGDVDVFEGVKGGGEGGVGGGRATEKVTDVESMNAGDGMEGQGTVEGGEEEEGKKENEPFAVPTAGAFYMHDDRFRDNAAGRHRRTYGGRRLWESKDDKKWGHDKFEEMTLQERHYEQGRRNSKGQYRSRGGKNQGPTRGYGGRNRSKELSNGSNHSQPKGVRGRGPRRYEPTAKIVGQTRPTQNKQPGKLFAKNSHGNSGRVVQPASNAEPDQVPLAKKNSSLSSASPPFYPSGSSNKDINLTQKRDEQGASSSRNLNASGADENFSMQQSSALVRGKNITEPTGFDKLYIDESITQSAGKPLTNSQMPLSGSSVVNTMQSSHSRSQGKGVAVSGQMSYQLVPPSNQVNRVSAATQLHSVQLPNQSRMQPSIQAHTQQSGQHSGNGTQVSPPKTPLSTNSHESGEVESASEFSKAKGALVSKGKGGIQASGRGSFLYGGAQIMGAAGNMGVGHGDQNFPGTHAFLPVMQFGGQHPGGMGVPAVGMAFPGYVANPQLGLGNSEMTWLPVLAGAAGALGATYCSPYITVDGNYHTRPSGQTSSTGSSSKENNANKGDNEWKPSHRPELVSDEFGQRQKPRRYSEMDFKQPSTST